MQTTFRTAGELLTIGEELIGASAVPYSDWVVATEDVDEAGDLLLLDGCDATAWRNQNCPVLLCHAESALIGNSKRDPRDLSAEPDIRIEKGRLIARCYHHIDSDDGRKALEWIRKGSINGASVAFRPAEGGLRKARPDERRAGIKRVIERWNLFEWSIVPTPCNSNTELLRACFPGEEAAKSIPGLIRKHLDEKETESTAGESNSESIHEDYRRNFEWIAAILKRHDSELSAISSELSAFSGQLLSKGLNP